MVKRGELNDTALLHVTGLKPNLAFDVFTVQRSSLDSSGAPVTGFKGFGLAWYQSDLQADDNGNAKVVIKTILSIRFLASMRTRSPAPARRRQPPCSSRRTHSIWVLV